MLPTCRDMSAKTRRVAPILARWVRVADTKLKMSWQFVSARADIYQIFRSAYVEIYYGMGVHTHRYYRTSQRSFLSCSPFSHVLQFVMFWRVTTHTHTTPTRENTHFIFRPGCLNRMIRPVTTTENMTIKRRTTGFGLKRPGVVWRLCFLKGILVEFFGGGGVG